MHNVWTQVSALAREFLKNPVSIRIGDNDGGLVANKNITQIVRVVPAATKYVFACILVQRMCG